MRGRELDVDMWAWAPTRAHVHAHNMSTPNPRPLTHAHACPHPPTPAHARPPMSRPRLRPRKVKTTEYDSILWTMATVKYYKTKCVPVIYILQRNKQLLFVCQNTDLLRGVSCKRRAVAKLGIRDTQS